MVKPRVGVQLREAIGGTKSAHRSADLDQLLEVYAVFSKHQRNVIISLKNHHRAMSQILQTRLQVARQVAFLSQKSPIYDCTGKLPSDDRPMESVSSYLSIHQAAAEKSKMFLNKYQQFVIQYIVEWEKVTNERISAGARKAEDLRRELDHYQKKVEALRLAANTAMSKGKGVTKESAEKLKRNEEKLVISKEGYNKLATDLCILIEEVTQRSWKDLHPMLLKMAQFDVTMSGDESKNFANLNSIVSELKAIGSGHGLSAQGRLHDLKELKPSQLSSEEDADLRIEGGGVFGTAPIDSLSTAATNTPGMGSYPSPADGSTAGSAPVNPTTLDMVKMTSASAPPPTFEEVHQSTMRQSGGPPHPGQSTNPFNDDGAGKQGDINAGFDNLSVSSSPPPPPAGLPPPPPSSAQMPGSSPYGGQPMPYQQPMSYQQPMAYQQPPMAYQQQPPMAYQQPPMAYQQPPMSYPTPNYQQPNPFGAPPQSYGQNAPMSHPWSQPPGQPGPPGQQPSYTSQNSNPFDEK